MIILLFGTSQPAICEEIFHIISSANSPCPGELTGEPCITLLQCINGEYRQYTSDDPSEITLEFQPGRYTLGDYGLYNTFASQLVSLTMNLANSTEIHCGYRRSREHLISNIQNVRVNGIDFVRCRFMIESVINFIVEESSFSQLQYDNALYIHRSSATIRGCNFTNNNGLPLHVDNSSIELYHTTFANNKGSRSGGALFAQNVQSTITISHCSFIDNSAYYNGGAIYTSSSLFINQSRFISNQVKIYGNGGAIYVNCDSSNCLVSIYQSMMKESSVRRGSGGAARIRGATISILNGTFSHNRAAENGGAFAIDDSEITIYRSTFDNNTAGANGGVIATEYIRSSLFISHTSFTNNQATNQGGVIYLRRKGSQVKISMSDISSNNAIRGGFATVLGSSLEIATTNTFNNTAEKGEIISACNSDILVSDQLFMATDPVYSVCTLFNGSINDTYDFEATTTTTETLVDTTTTIDIPTTTSGPSPATTTTSTSATAGRATEPNIMPSVYFQLNDKVYPNNSVISLSDVGENEQALMCRTDLLTCCATPPNRFGEFYYPSGDAVSVKKAGHGFYRDRGAQEVRLNRREGVISPSGRFRCAVPDASGTMQNLFIHLL